MNINQIICRHCGNQFNTKGKYDTHYKSKHQRKVRFNYRNNEKDHIERTEDGKFTCVCGKQFVKGVTLIYHQKKL